MKAIPSIIRFVFLKIVVEGLVNGFNVGLYRMTDDIRYALGRFFDVLKVQWLVVTVE